MVGEGEQREIRVDEVWFAEMLPKKTESPGCGSPGFQFAGRTQSPLVGLFPVQVTSAATTRDVSPSKNTVKMKTIEGLFT